MKSLVKGTQYRALGNKICTLSTLNFLSLKGLLFLTPSDYFWENQITLITQQLVKTLLCYSCQIRLMAQKRTLNCKRIQHRNKLKAGLKEREMEQSKCLLQGPRMAFKGLWTYPQLATCLLQARHNTAGLGLGSKPTAAKVPCYRAAPPLYQRKKMWRRGRVWGVF